MKLANMMRERLDAVVASEVDAIVDDDGEADISVSVGRDGQCPSGCVSMRRRERMHVYDRFSSGLRFRCEGALNYSELRLA